MPLPYTQKERDDFQRNLNKGLVGEQIIQQQLEKEGWVVYFPFDKTKAHLFDMLSTTLNADCMACDVKTKRALRLQDNFYTGFNVKHFDRYQQFAAKNQVPFYVYFVDDVYETIHRVDLRNLEPGRAIGSNAHIYIWPMDKMEFVRKLTTDENQMFVQLKTQKR